MPDDNEPITDEWLDAVYRGRCIGAWTQYLIKREYDENDERHFCETWLCRKSLGDRSCWLWQKDNGVYYHDTTVYLPKTPTTRGEWRALCFGLGIQPEE